LYETISAPPLSAGAVQVRTVDVDSKVLESGYSITSVGAPGTLRVIGITAAPPSAEATEVPSMLMAETLAMTTASSTRLYVVALSTETATLRVLVSGFGE
jgi:hypothetical protein